MVKNLKKELQDVGTRDTFNEYFILSALLMELSLI